MKTINNKLEVIITPQNEGQELNYVEHFFGDELALKQKLGAMQHHLKIALPKASINIKIEDRAGINEWFYDNGSFYDENYKEIKLNTRLVAY